MVKGGELTRCSEKTQTYSFKQGQSCFQSSFGPSKGKTIPVRRKQTLWQLAQQLSVISTCKLQPEVGDLVLQEHPEPLFDLLKTLFLFHSDSANPVRPEKHPLVISTMMSNRHPACAQVEIKLQTALTTQHPRHVRGRFTFLSRALHFKVHFQLLVVRFCFNPAPFHTCHRIWWKCYQTYWDFTKKYHKLQ